MQLRIGFLMFILTLGASGGLLAQGSIQGGTLEPSAAPTLPVQDTAAANEKPTGHIVPLSPSAPIPEIITDLSRLPAPVARTRERILAAARSGDLQQLAALMNETMPIFSFTEEKIRSRSGRRPIPTPTASRRCRS